MFRPRCSLKNSANNGKQLETRVSAIDSTPHNAAIHEADVMNKKRRQWAKQGLHLYYLPPYSPELNRIEILWKHAKYFWRRFAAVNGALLLEEVQSLMSGFGKTFTINFV